MPENKQETKTTSEYLVTFSKPYTFEGKEYKELDLSRLETLTSEQLFEVSRHFSTSEYINPRPEADPKFCCMVASVVCSLPQEFFNRLPLRDGLRIRNVVQTFFQSEV